MRIIKTFSDLRNQSGRACMRGKHLVRLLIFALPLIWMALAPPVRHAMSADDADTFTKSIQPFLAANCYDCHNAGLKSGGLDLEAFKSTAMVLQDREHW